MTKPKALVLLAGALLLAANAHAGELEDLTAQLRGKVGELEKLRAELAAELPPPPAADTANGCYVLTIQGGLDGNGLVVQAVRRKGTFTEARAWATKGCPLHFLADPTGLKVEGGRLTGALRVDVVAWAGLEDHDPDLGQVFPSHYSVDAPLEKKATGKATITNPESAAALSGVATCEFVPLKQPAFKKMPSFKGKQDLVLLEAIYDHGFKVWRQLRALEMSRRLGLPYELALDQVPELAFAWPKPAAPKPKGKKKAPKKKKKVPDLLDLDVDLDEEPAVEKDDALSGLDKEMAALSLTPAQIISVARPMIAHIEQYIEAGKKGVTQKGRATVTRGSLSSGDPDFVATPGSDPADGKKKVVLPDTLGQPGPARWVHATQMQMISIGPIMMTPWGGHSPVLPALVVDRRALYNAHIAAIKAQGYPRSAYMAELRKPAVEPEDPERWGEAWKVPPEGATHHIRPWDHVPTMPMCGRFWAPYSAKPNYTFPAWEYTGSYHAIDVESPRDAEVWCTIEGAYAANIAVNGKLVWESDRYHANPQLRPHAWLTRLPLKKGLNHVLLYADHVGLTGLHGLRFCVQGGPRPEAEAKAVAAKREAAYEKLANPIAGVRQFRRNHTGRHPEADPPIAFDFENDHNIGWFRRLLHGVGNVLVMDGLLITTENPNVVVGIDKMTGEVKWRQRVDVFQFKYPDKWKQVEPIYAEIDKLDPTDKANTEKREALYEKLIALYPSKYHPMPAAKMQANFTSPIMNCPITDGKFLWVKQDGGTLAKLDATGKKHWVVDMGASGGQMGYTANSPVYTEGKIICQIPAYKNEDLARAKWDDQGGWPWERQVQRRARIVCHDADTGKAIWGTDKLYLPHWGNRYDADGIPTPFVTRLTNGDEQMDVVVTGGAQVWRAEDGKRLLDSMGHMNVSHPYMPLGPGTFLVFSQVHYHKSGGYPAAVRLVMESRDEIRAETLWVGQQFRSFGLGGGVEQDGLLIGVEGKRRGTLTAFDKKTGKLAAQLFPVFRHAPGHAYPMPTLAGKAVYFFCDGRITYNGNTRWAIDQRRAKGEKVEYPRWLAGNCSVVLPGRDPLILARNQMLPTDGPTYGPEVDADRMYFRLRSGVLCIRADDPGKAWQAGEVAETLLAQLPTAVLGSEAPLKPAQKLARRPIVDDRYRTRRGTMTFINGQVRTGWYAVGPLPQAEAGMIEAKIADGKLNWLGDGKGVPKTFGKYPLTDISRDQNFKKGWNIALTPENCVARQGIAYSIPMAHEDKAGTTLYWIGAIAMRGQKALRWDCPNPAVKCWIGATEVKHGQRITLGRGTWQLVLRTDLKEGAEPFFRPRLWDATDLAAEKAFLKSRLARMQPYFEEAKALAKDDQLTARIKAVEGLGE